MFQKARDLIRRRPLAWLAPAFALGVLAGGGGWEAIEEPEPLAWGTAAPDLLEEMQ